MNVTLSVDFQFQAALRLGRLLMTSINSLDLGALAIAECDDQGPCRPYHTS